MEILRELPNHLKFNVLKYLQHPTAAIMREPIDLYELRNRDITFVEFAIPQNVLKVYCECCGELWHDCNCTSDDEDDDEDDE